MQGLELGGWPKVGKFDYSAQCAIWDEVRRGVYAKGSQHVHDAQDSAAAEPAPYACLAELS